MRELIVYKRHLKTGVFFYSRFMNQKTKKYDTSFSIEKLKSLLGYETSKRTRSRGEAFRIALAAIDAGIIETAKKKEKSPELAKYVLSFWDYDNSEYIRMKNLVKPNSVGPDYANNMVGTFKKNLLPLIPNGLLLTELTQEMIEGWILELVKKGKISKNTINSVIKSVSVAIGEAVRRGKLKTDPTTNIKYLDTSDTKEKGIPKKEEVSSLLEHMKNHSNEKIYLATRLAVSSGMRQGEILALRKENIDTSPEGDIAIITVKEAIAKKAGFKSTKGKKIRYAPIPKTLAASLLEHADKNPWGNGLVFWSTKTKDTPIASSYVRDGYYEALDAIGIKEEERKRRNIDFHSLRHYYNSMMRGNVEESDLRSVIGHESVRMTDHYTHAVKEKLIEIGTKAQNVLGIST